MSTRTKKRLCWNCEGNVLQKEEICPYCGVSLNQVQTANGNGKKETVKAPYKSVDSEEPKSVPVAPYAAKEEERTEPESTPLVSADDDDLTPEHEVRVIIITMTLLLGGTVLFLFGLIMLLFSEEGFLTLRWNADYWFIYLLFAIPMLYLGFRNMRYLQDDSGK